MSKRYNLDDIKTNMKKELEEAEALGKAWAAVTYTTKKDRLAGIKSPPRLRFTDSRIAANTVLSHRLYLHMPV